MGVSLESPTNSRITNVSSSVCLPNISLASLGLSGIDLSDLFIFHISLSLRSHDISVPRSIDQSNFKAFLLVSEQKTLFYKSMQVLNYFAMLCWIFNLCKTSGWLAASH